MSIVESHQSVALGIMQGEGVAQPMRSLRRCFHALDFEFQPIAPLEMMDATIEPQQELERVFVE